LSADKPAASEPTEIAGRYQIVKKLGAGAFGEVFKAKDRVLGRMVAIKTIRLEGLAAAGASQDEMVDRFKREAQVSAQLKHPNIVTIYDVGEADGKYYLAMEFIDGVGLEKVISSAGRLTVERAASIAAQVADGLDFAHKNHVVHRDIKPANIMIESGDRVKVTDFGIAKTLNSGEHLTMTGSLLGTPSYMSPEQARGGEIDGRSDLFSVGCVLYEMLAGQKAFRGESITALIFKIITEEPPPLHTLDPSIPGEVVSIISKALSKAPETRFQSGRELFDALQPFTRAGSTPTMRVAETPTQKSSPNLMATTVTPPTMGAKTPPTVVSTTPPPRATPPPPPRATTAPPPPVAQASPRPAKSSSNLGLFVFLGMAFLAVVAVAGAAGWYFFLRKPPQVAEASPTPETLAPATTVAAPPPVTVTQGTAPPPPEPPVATQPPQTQPPTRTADAGRDTRRTAPPQAMPDQTTGTSAPDDHFLDQEPQAMDGAEAGRRVADAYSGNRSSGSAAGYGGGRLNARPRSPRDLAPMEMPAVATLRWLMNAEETYRRKKGQYASLRQLVESGDLPAPRALSMGDRSFNRKGYRFELSLSADGFNASATPMAPGVRPFVGDDSGYIRSAVD
jgi:eukaryotic-like serine/threonine-protein kinase